MSRRLRRRNNRFVSAPPLEHPPSLLSRFQDAPNLVAIWRDVAEPFPDLLDLPRVRDLLWFFFTAFGAQPFRQPKDSRHASMAIKDVKDVWQAIRRNQEQDALRVNHITAWSMIAPAWNDVCNSGEAPSDSHQESRRLAFQKAVARTVVILRVWQQLHSMARPVHP